MATTYHNEVDTSGQAVQSGPAIDLRHLGGQLHQLLQEADSEEAATDELCDLVPIAAVFRQRRVFGAMTKSRPRRPPRWDLHNSALNSWHLRRQGGPVVNEDV